MQKFDVISIEKSPYNPYPMDYSLFTSMEKWDLTESIRGIIIRSATGCPFAREGEIRRATGMPKWRLIDMLLEAERDGYVKCVDFKHRRASEWYGYAPSDMQVCGWDRAYPLYAPMEHPEWRFGHNPKK